VDEEIEVEEDSSLHMVSSRKPQPVPLTEENAASPGSDEATDEDMDIDGSTTPLIYDDFWNVAHPNSPVTTPLTQVPQSPAITEEIHTGSEGHQPSLQTIAEEVLDEEIVQPMISEEVAPPPPQQEEPVPSADSDTVPFATAEEVAKSLAITDPNDSTVSPRPIYDVRPKKINLQPVPSMPKVGKSMRRPKFDNAAFFGEKNFFIGESPYDNAKIRRQ
jgi:hypothetical protein